MASAAVSSAVTAVKSAAQTLRRFMKAPWEITGPCADPEYRSALPGALEYRPYCPASEPAKAIVPTSDPETVFDIKYYTRDRRRDRHPVRRTVLRKADVERIMAEKTFGPADFPRVYVTEKVEEDYNARGGGYESGYKNESFGYAQLLSGNFLINGISR